MTTKKNSTKSLAEQLLAVHLGQHDISFEREHCFHPTRGWRFDFALLEPKIAIEIEGGIWVGGRHTRAQGFLDDIEKYNEALLLGWRVLRFDTDRVYDGRAIATTLLLLNLG